MDGACLELAASAGSHVCRNTGLLLCCVLPAVGACRRDWEEQRAALVAQAEQLRREARQEQQAAHKATMSRGHHASTGGRAEGEGGLEGGVTQDGLSLEAQLLRVRRDLEGARESEVRQGWAELVLQCILYGGSGGAGQSKAATEQQQQQHDPSVCVCVHA